MSDNKIKLPELPRLLREKYEVVVRYRQVYGAVLDGIIPAERTPSGWVIASDDLPEIAETFGYQTNTSSDLEFVG